MPTKPNKRRGDRESTDKEFTIMKMKMIQNVESKLELQINSLETGIKKI